MSPRGRSNHIGFQLTKFTDLGLSQPLLDALASKNYAIPTPIQAQAIPTVLTGRDLLGIAQTGTGKTAAFMLPSLDRLASPRVHPIPKRVRMLVLAPTRELASQIAESAKTYSRNINLSIDVIFGGTPPMKSVRAVARGQVWMTGTEEMLFADIASTATCLRVVDGTVLTA